MAMPPDLPLRVPATCSRPTKLVLPSSAVTIKDGDHRVGVARYRGVRWIDAEVTYCHTREPWARRIGAKPATVYETAAA
jgi:hypothetical protein